MRMPRWSIVIITTFRRQPKPRRIVHLNPMSSEGSVLIISIQLEQLKLVNRECPRRVHLMIITITRLRRLQVTRST